MRSRGIALLALALVAACGGPGAAGTPADGTTSTAPTEIDVAGLKALTDGGKAPVVVDVRTDGEWESGHVPGALHIPMNDVAARIGELEPHKGAPIYVICAAGGRSASVAQQLRGQGFQTVNVAGGTNAWKSAGYPVE